MGEFSGRVRAYETMLNQMSQEDTRKKKKKKLSKKNSKKRSKHGHDKKESVDEASYKYFKLKTECLAKKQPIKQAIYMKILKTLKLFRESIQMVDLSQMWTCMT